MTAKAVDKQNLISAVFKANSMEIYATKCKLNHYEIKTETKLKFEFIKFDTKFQETTATTKIFFNGSLGSE